MTPRVFAAVDLGASSGRVMAGLVEAESVSLQMIHSFPNGARTVDDRLRWPFERLYDDLLTGLERLVAKYPQVESVGIDTWGVDYGLLDADGRLLAEPTSHRDERTLAAVDQVHAVISAEEMFALNGLQFLSFNTVYQLAAEKAGPLWSKAARLVLLPDLIAYWLTGQLLAERTNASTTGLLDVVTGEWSAALTRRLGIPGDIFPPLVSAGSVIGRLRPEICQRLGVEAPIVVTAVGSHDTASAVAGVPARNQRFAYVASGTWSLVGVEVAAPVLTKEAFAANFTNERGVDDRWRFLRNTGGAWLIQESIRSWSEEGHQLEIGDLLAEAAALPPAGPVIDVDDPAFLTPGDMPARIATAAGADSLLELGGPAALVRCVTDSLAGAYAVGARRAARLGGVEADVIHIVGGGSQSPLLCQATADASGLPVIAGPVEATAFGNVMVQAGASGAVPPGLQERRDMIAASVALTRFEPV